MELSYLQNVIETAEYTIIILYKSKVVEVISKPTKSNRYSNSRFHLWKVLFYSHP